MPYRYLTGSPMRGAGHPQGNECCRMSLFHLLRGGSVMGSDSSCNRREVLGALVGASLAALPAGAAASDHSGVMIYRTFGRTGIQGLAIGLGGSPLGSPAGGE